MTTQLRITNLGYCVSDHAILKDINLEISAGVTGLIGPNGSGKSTLLKLLAGVLAPTSGEIHLNDRPLATMEAASRARHIAYIPQDAQVHWPIPVERVVELGRLPHLAPWQHAGDKDLAIVENALRDSDTLHLRKRTVDTLSGGEKARVMIARALASHPRLLLADEPTAALDPAHQLTTMTLLRRLSEEGLALLISLHDLSLAASYCDRLILLDQGLLVEAAEPARVLTEKHLAQVYKIQPQWGEHEIASLLHYPWVSVTE